MSQPTCPRCGAALSPDAPLACPSCGAVLKLVEAAPRGVDVDAVRAHLAAGRRIDAVRVVREQAGLGLKEAMDVVDRLARDPTATPGDVAPADVDLDAVRELVAERRMIPAIKLLREQTGLGLKEAKDAVDALARGERPTIAVDAAARERIRAASTGSWGGLGCLVVLALGCAGGIGLLVGLR